MKKLALFFTLFLVFSGLLAKSADDFFSDVKMDYQHFYALPNLLELSAGVAVSGIFANTALDQDIANNMQQHWRSKTTNDISKAFKPFGSKLFIAGYLAGMGLPLLDSQSHFAQVVNAWSKRSLRAFIVAAPTVLLLQYGLGSGRPNAADPSSHWRPFKHSEGVSGHSFLGAIPFLTAASMTDNRFAKIILTGASVLSGLSRINDNQHYFSQVALGWWIAYLAVNTVSSDNSTTIAGMRLTPIAYKDGGGVALTKPFA